MIMDRKIWLHNGTQSSIKAAPFLSAPYQYTDLMVDIGLCFFGVGEVTGACKAVAGLPEVIVTVEDFVAYLKVAVPFLSGSVSATGRMFDFGNAIKAFVDSKFKETDAHHEHTIFDSSGTDYFSPSAWIGLTGAPTMTMVVIDDTNNRYAMYSSPNDQSWIAKDAGIVQAKMGTLNVVDEDNPNSQPWISGDLNTWKAIEQYIETGASTPSSAANAAYGAPPAG